MFAEKYHSKNFVANAFTATKVAEIFAKIIMTKLDDPNLKLPVKIPLDLDESDLSDYQVIHPNEATVNQEVETQRFHILENGFKLVVAELNLLGYIVHDDLSYNGNFDPMWIVLSLKN